MRVTARFFAALREEIADREMTFALEEGATVHALLERLVAAHPQVSDHLDSLHVAVNQVYADAQTVLRDGDEVALLPPVGGG